MESDVHCAALGGGGVGEAIWSSLRYGATRGQYCCGDPIYVLLLLDSRSDLYFVLCCLVLCYVVLCRAVVCCVVLCCAVLRACVVAHIGIGLSARPVLCDVV